MHLKKIILIFVLLVCAGSFGSQAQVSIHLPDSDCFEETENLILKNHGISNQDGNIRLFRVQQKDHRRIDEEQPSPFFYTPLISSVRFGIKPNHFNGSSIYSSAGCYAQRSFLSLRKILI